MDSHRVSMLTGREGEDNWTPRIFLAENSRMRIEAHSDKIYINKLFMILDMAVGRLAGFTHLGCLDGKGKGTKVKQEHQNSKWDTGQVKISVPYIIM
ncbi:hypothetical protein MTR_6g012635 [Medicago truncatula]|uniref:Uncharacterized protein n=1 Tax=Medicago truncatula TaxID=3880 RepID=A0A072U5I4_MEDTR|nr:hypothetical protein MTR_6g012635 [Medicago truncatula]